MIEFHKAWIIKAESDLKTAEIALRQNDPMITDVAIFHTQQCAEKALKGFLAFKQSKIRKIHHLVPLVDQCTAFDPNFETLILDASDLTPLGTEFRYPEVTHFLLFLSLFIKLKFSTSPQSWRLQKYGVYLSSYCVLRCCLIVKITYQITALILLPVVYFQAVFFLYRHLRCLINDCILAVMNI